MSRYIMGKPEVRGRQVLGPLVHGGCLSWTSRGTCTHSRQSKYRCYTAQVLLCLGPSSAMIRPTCCDGTDSTWDNPIVIETCGPVERTISASTSAVMIRPKYREDTVSTWDSHTVIETCGPVERTVLVSASAVMIRPKCRDDMA